MAELPEELRRLIGSKTDDVAKVIDGLVSQLDLLPAEEEFARGQACAVFNLLSQGFVDAHPTVQRARAATAAAVIAFKMLQIWAEHDEATSPE